jgi:acyl-CoA thioester hydrolase
VAFTVANLEIDYRLPARLDDLLEVHTDVPLIRRASMMFEQELRRAGDAQRMAHARVRVGCVDSREFRPIALPDAVLQAVAREKQAKNI